MNRQLSNEEEEAFNKLIGLRVGALYADARDSAIRVAAEILNQRMEKGKADGAVWLISSNESALTMNMLEAILKEKSACVSMVTFQSLSHNSNVFFGLLHLARSSRRMLVIDDGLFIKNVNAVCTFRVWMLASGCPYRLLIAGAPFEKDQIDMFSQWYALDARILGYKSYWSFCVNHIRFGKLVNGEYLSRAIAPYTACVQRENEHKTLRKEYVWQFRLPEEVLSEYRRVAKRFEKKALYSKAGVYRMLTACHMAASGRRIVRDFPLETAPIYKSIAEDARIKALLEILSKVGDRNVLIVSRFHFELEAVHKALCEICGEETVHMPGDGNEKPRARFYLRGLYLEKRSLPARDIHVIIHFSQSWSLRKRREKEEAAGIGQNATIINIVAADTIDMMMVKRVWKKERSIEDIFRLLTGRKDGKADAQDLQG